MNETESPLPGLLAQWRELTEREGEAIRAAQWPEVTRQQRLKEALQPAISRVDPEVRSLPRFRTAVTELMALERRNAEFLGERLGHLRRLRDESEQASRNLRRMRQSYAPASASNWHSYS
ncbi:MAG TPA: hypothetical protein VMB21_01515 [Candidatus Limnocylindria bacterium]|jgi:hypothetical protein|nr:hypothetical protein [Candidatus Limnocylindria bacterium]